MSVDNVVKASFVFGKSTKTRGLHQWDYGQVLKFEGLSLPSAYTVHFANQLLAGNAKTQVGGADGVTIPDEYLITGLPVYAWVFLHAGADDGETVYSVTIPVTARPRPVEDAPTPVQQGAIDTAIAALNEGVAAAEDAQEAIENLGVTAETLDAGSSATVTKFVDQETGAVTLAFGIPKGEQGPEGQRGPYGFQGPRGYTFVPSVSDEGVISWHNNGNLQNPDPVNIKGPAGQDGSPGQDGQDGQPGADGYSPAVSVSKSGSTATISITDKNGTTTAQVSDGQNGINGQDGAPGVGVPAGGTTGQVLKKASGTDYDTEWVDKNPVVQVSGSTPTITTLPGVRYVCGECATLDITLPVSGCVDVVFESGSTATVLTITPPTGQTVKWANGFDPTALDANTTYEINIMDGLGVAVGWT